MSQKLVVDSSSIINLFDFYYFDRFNGGKIYQSLIGFIIDKVLSDEIIVLDMVFNELKRSDYDTFKKAIGNKVVRTPQLVNKVIELRDRYSIPENESQYDQMELVKAKEKYETEHADLYLVVYCNELKSSCSPILICDESKKDDKKIVKKIPTICKKENEDILCKGIPSALFEIYKSQLKFSLNIV